LCTHKVPERNHNGARWDLVPKVEATRRVVQAAAYRTEKRSVSLPRAEGRSIARPSTKRKLSRRPDGCSPSHRYGSSPDRLPFKRRSATQTETRGPLSRTRSNPDFRRLLQEIIEFAHRMKYHRLDIVFCDGLRREAAVVAKVLSRQGFEVVPAGSDAPAA
jgi:hypothetical protein